MFKKFNIDNRQMLGGTIIKGKRNKTTRIDKSLESITRKVIHVQGFSLLILFLIIVLIPLGCEKNIINNNDDIGRFGELQGNGNSHISTLTNNENILPEINPTEDTENPTIPPEPPLPPLHNLANEMD